jgi:type II secretion system protein G
MRKMRGFTLIELLIVVAIIGIIAAIAIPNMLDAIERSRQKRSTGEIKTMATAAQSFSTDFGGYPDGATAGGDPNATWNTITNIGGNNVIVPDLIQAVPVADGWKTIYQYQAGPDSATGSTDPNAMANLASNFIIFSDGSDRADGCATCTDNTAGAAAIQGTWLADPPVPSGTLNSHCYQADIVWGNSSFLQAPEGKQKKC